MKRAETFWQAMVLVLVFMMTIGVWVMLGWLLSRLRTESPASATQLYQPQYAVQITEPLQGAVLQESASVVVRSVAAESGFVRANLNVDGQDLVVQVNPDPRAAPWIAQWVWKDPGEGSHRLLVKARTAEGAVEASDPVSVTVVPGGSLVFASNRDGSYAVYGMQTDGDGLVRLTGGPGDARQPAPKKDGVLAFVAEGEDGRSVIRELKTKSGKVNTLLAGVDPAWAPDNLHLAYATSVQGVSQVFTAAADAGMTQKVTAEETYAGQPCWSPDGSRLAYVAEQDGNWDIWVTAVEGGEPRRLTTDVATDWAPAWSPDGSQLAFVSDRGGSHQIHVMRTDGTNVRRLSGFASGAEAPAWAPDGFWLAFVAYAGDGTGINAREIHLMRSDGSDVVRLTHNAFDDSDVAWNWMP